MERYRVAQVGCGNRGKVHLDGWLAHPERFELVAVCDLDEAKMRQAIEARRITPALYTDADRMLAETRPDVFCFSTPPAIRLALVELAARHGVKGLAFEKPMATSLAEARAILALCRAHGIKAVVSHQHKYLTSFQKLAETVRGGDIGRVERIEATCQAWLAQLGTHFVDYVLWANGGCRARWVVGHVHGRELLADSHPSPNYTMGQIGFENGVRAFVEFGKLSASHMGKDRFWLDNRLTVYGTHGTVWCDTDGRWGRFTRRTDGDAVSGEGEPWRVQQSVRLQPLFARDFADWLDDERRPHPCRLDLSYHGYEIMEGLCLSALNHVRVDLPLPENSTPEDLFDRLRRELPDCHELS
ncbi:MAG: Gfo/Idh/MocA family oxidoreductase [Lentisphaeria bacterium]|nr:Gfo/Idh/MocA family oxidoreductase [Lentisphaeria bacterium]